MLKPIKIRSSQNKLILDWAVPIMLAFQTIISTLQIIDYFSFSYYPMVNRVTSKINFKLKFDPLWLLIILLIFWIEWVILKKRFKLLIFPALSLILLPIFNLRFTICLASFLSIILGLLIYRNNLKYISSLLLLFLVIDLIALLHWLVFISLGVQSPFKDVAIFEMGVYFLSAQLAPYIILLFIFMWGLKKIARLRYVQNQKIMIEIVKYDDFKFKRFTLLILLGVVAALCPLLPTVNPNLNNIGTDLPRYVSILEEIQNDPNQLVNSNRPFLLIILFGLQITLRLDSQTIVTYITLILIPVFLISVYFMSKEFFNSHGYAFWSTFFTLSGLHTTVGIYAYFLANILALSLTFLSLGCLFRVMRSGKKKDIFFASVTGSLVIFTHPWTLIHYTTVTCIMTIYILYESWKINNYKKFKNILFFLASLGLIELLKSILLGGDSSGVRASITVMNGISGISDFWITSTFVFRRLYGGLMSNIILLLLAVLGYFLLNKDDFPQRYFSIFIAVSSLLYLISNATIKSRLLYNIPIGMYAASGFMLLLNIIKENNLRKVLSYFIVTNSVLYLFRSLVNIV